MSTPTTPTEDFLQRLSNPLDLASGFDRVSDIVFFIKDREGRYVAVNDTLVHRCGLEHKNELLGRTVDSLFEATLSGHFSEQDRRVLTEGISIVNHLELHVYPDGKQGWCLTYKEPLRDKDGQIIGISGISRDLQAPAGADSDYPLLAKVIDYIHAHFEEPLRLPQLAAMAKLSVYQFEQRIRRLFNISPGQYISKVRIEHACHLLKNSQRAIVEIALDCGFSDQSAFSRQFKQTVGMTPRAYRKDS